MNQPLPASLAARWAALRADEPRLRIRDAAERLGVREAELVQLDPRAVRLRPDWKALYEAMPSLGPVMCLTRNDHCVHERRGTFETVQASGAHVLVLGPDIDLRGFPGRWGAAFALPVENARGTLHSVQIFDRCGDAVQKIYVEPGGDVAAWEALVAGLRAGDDLGLFVPRAERAAPPTSQEHADPDTAGLLEDWAALRDTHDFFPLLRRRKLPRHQALALAEGVFTRTVDRDRVEALLEAAAAAEVPLMAFVGNPGMIQIHSGPVVRVLARGGWLNVLDPAFNLHLREEGVARVHVVRKPTADGDVHSLELLDAEGRVLLQLFGTRKPGLPEDGRWRALLAEVVGGLPGAA